MEKTVLAIMIIIVMSKILGFFRDIFLSFFFGATNVTDAYLIAMTIPTVLFAFIGMGIAASFIPIFTKISAHQGEAEAKRFTANLVNIVLIFSTLIIAAILIFPVPIVKLFAYGFEGETLKLAVDFTRISSLSIYFVALLAVFNSYLEINGKFLIAAFTGLPLNIIMISFIYVSSVGNIYWLAYGYVIAVAIQFLFLVPAIRRTGYRHKMYLKPKEENIKSMMFLALPVIIGVSVDQINVLVDRTIASQIVGGGISALTYSNRITFFIEAIFVTAIVTVLFPKITKMAVRKDMIQLKWIVGKMITSIGLLIIPSTVGLMIFSKEITVLLFGRGAFEDDAVLLTAGALFFYSFGMLGFGLREVLAKVFYSLEDSKTPMVSALAAMVINVILNIVLSRIMGISGLALATSIAAIVSTAYLYIALVRKIGSIGSKLILLDLGKALIASGIMGVGAKQLYFILGESYWSLAASMSGGVLIYAVVLMALKVSDASYYKDRLMALGRKSVTNE
ncbi:murein biosynthesis integral membrane protein MurJ [Planococcus sp. N028]|uniref:Probable lipid II flippase MurJ n=1 Tax=Planococcus shixiaomingii TaxID=3058393 RepID=A0ABT8N159_9BACL|nr:murein biosynthesis integral membrane protein MurJ [Planococcus sp. N028]MDN7241620.1 murein biosynthesis integral membrane protein MurJ [Planococcus sp. N028]